MLLLGWFEKLGTSKSLYTRSKENCNLLKALCVHCFIIYLLCILKSFSFIFYRSQQHAHVARKWQRWDLHAVLSVSKPTVFPLYLVTTDLSSIYLYFLISLTSHMSSWDYDYRKIWKTILRTNDKSRSSTICITCTSCVNHVSQGY